MNKSDELRIIIYNLLNDLSKKPKYIKALDNIKLHQFFSDEIIVGYKYPLYFLAFKCVDNRSPESMEEIVISIEDNINQLISHSFRMKFYNHKIIRYILRFHIIQFLDYIYYILTPKCKNKGME